MVKVLVISEEWKKKRGLIKGARRVSGGRNSMGYILNKKSEKISKAFGFF